ncbi:putative multidrug resistance protein fnx1 [Hypoxylon sp. FL1857]|nr:putative multidrug resistance protein fnx1 [Hypoxylon sp. FL1857]
MDPTQCQNTGDPEKRAPEDEPQPTADETVGAIVVEDNASNNRRHLQGSRFWLITIALAIQVFMVNLEVPVVTTALVSIVGDLSGFDQLSWVVSSYILGYVAVIVIFSKFSDIWGRKPILLLSIVIFIIFSAACSASQTMAQLIIFRAFQGVGGGGCFSLSQVIIADLVPPDQYTKYVSQIAIVSSLAFLLGPIVGGAISSHTTWRWIFIINVPISSAALVFTIIGMPKGFPHHHPSSLRKVFSKATLARVDFLGTFLLLFAVLSLTAGFEEAGSGFPWKSAYVIALLVLSGCFWALLLLWERYVTLRDSVREPVLPWIFFTNRVVVGALLSLLFLGGPIIVSIFQLPERFQLVYGLSGLDAGVRLIPFSLAAPFGTGVASGIGNRLKVPAIYIVLAGACFQVIGFALLGTLPATLDIPPRIYGFEILAGFGCGMNFTPLFLAIPQVVEPHYLAVGIGAGNQSRMIGTAIMIAISTSVFNSYVRPELFSLSGLTDTNPIAALEQGLGNLPLDTQSQIRLILAKGYNRQMLVLCASAAAQIPSALLLWKRKQILI